MKRSLDKRSLIKLFTQAHWFRVVSRAGLFVSGQISGQVEVGFGIKFVNMFRADYGRGYKIFCNDGYFCHQLLLKQSR